MYKLFRRISGSIFPRPDRPWDEDATSNAPQIGRKRRMSEDDEEPPATPSLKKTRTGFLDAVGEAGEEGFVSPGTDEAAEDVKEVTKGVQEVEIDDTKEHEADEAVATEEPAAVPLPESPVIQATAAEVSEPGVPEVVAEMKEDDAKEGEAKVGVADVAEEVVSTEEKKSVDEAEAKDTVEATVDETTIPDVDTTPATTASDAPEETAEPAHEITPTESSTISAIPV